MFITNFVHVCRSWQMFNFLFFLMHVGRFRGITGQYAHMIRCRTHHTVPVVSPVSVEVGQVTVFVPPGATVGQGTVTEGDVIVWVNGSPGPALMVGHSITWGSSTIINKIIVVVVVVVNNIVFLSSRCVYVVIFCWSVHIWSLLCCSSWDFLPFLPVKRFFGQFFLLLIRGVRTEGAVCCTDCEVPWGKLWFVLLGCVNKTDLTYRLIYLNFKNCLKTGCIQSNLPLSTIYSHRLYVAHSSFFHALPEGRNLIKCQI